MSPEPIEERFPLLAAVSDPVVVTDTAGSIVYVNSTYEQLTLYRRDQLLGETPRIVKSGRQDETFYEQLWGTILSGRAFQAKFANRNKRGDIYHVEETISPLRDSDGRTYFVSIGRDLALSRHTALEVQKLALVAEQSADHVLITSPDGTIEYVNAAFQALAGYSREEAMGQTPPLIKSGQHPQNFYRRMWNRILAGNVYRGVTINRKKNGELYYEEKTITPIRDSEANIIHFVSVGRDITGRMRAEKELKESRERLLLMNHILEKYTQPAVLKILNSGVNPLEIAPVTVRKIVFFTDMMHFSLFSERLNVGELTQLVEKYLTVCADVITENGGEVMKFMGDCAMAYFPVARADQAIRAGVDIIAAIESLRRDVPKTSPMSVLYAGVGMALGQVTEGNIGSPNKKDYTILGDAVNVASRLEDLTRELSVPLCLSRDVKAHAKEPWEFRLLGRQGIKGRDAPVDVYSVRDERLRASCLSDQVISDRIRKFLL